MRLWGMREVGITFWGERQDTMLDTWGTTATNAGRATLSPGSSWGSYEQFRLSGSTGLIEGVPKNRVGFLRVRDVEFAILRRTDFDRLVGLAADAVRLMRGIPLFRSAVELVARNQGGERELAVRHLQELTITFPELVSPSLPTFSEVEVTGDDPNAEDLDPATVEMPRARTRIQE
jgi:hypothetical protein